MQKNQIFIFLTAVAVVAFRAAHLDDGPSRVPAITTLPKAVSAVKSEKTICLIICEIYPITGPSQATGIRPMQRAQ